MALLHELNLASGKQLTPLQLSNLTMRVFGQPGQLGNFPDQVKMVAKEYNRWCHPIKSEQLVSDLKKHYAGQGIGRSGRKARRAEGSDSEPEEQGRISMLFAKIQAPRCSVDSWAVSCSSSADRAIMPYGGT